MKKIAYVLTSYPVLSETFVGTEMRSIEACGHEVQPFAFNHYQGEYQQQDQALKDRTIYLSDHSNLLALKGFAYLRLGVLTAIKFSLLQQGLSFNSLIGNALKLVYLARKNNCTHFHAHFSQGAAATAIVAARMCGMSVSFVGHGHDIYATPQDLALKLNSVDFAVAVCKDMRNDFKALAPKVNASLVYCGIEPERFQAPKMNPENQNATGKVDFRDLQCKSGKLLFIGRLCETKGLFTLLQALALVPESARPKLDLVGDGVLKDALVNYACTHQLNEYVSFLGAKQSSWFITHSCDYDAMIAPFELGSNGDRDTGPVVVKEAMALKLAVITTHFMGCKEFITPSTGLRVPPKNPMKLSQAIQQFYRMSALDVQRMKNNAYNRVNALYTAKKQALKLSSSIEQQG